jgi:pimeloyl-ACP methyl ester carboxylesterase
MADDLEVILRAVENKFGERATIGAFHSLSTIVSLLHSPRYGMRWAALILFDPPLAPPAGHRLQKFARDFELSLRDWALRRQRKFKTSEELARHFQGARRMQRWTPGAADLMARSITRPSSEGGVELVCPPEFEAAIYEQNSNSSAWSIVPSVAEEILVVCGDFNVADADPPSLVSQALHIEFGVSVVAVPDSGHLLQIERPREVERIVRDHLRSLGVAPP